MKRPRGIPIPKPIIPKKLLINPIESYTSSTDSLSYKMKKKKGKKKE